MKKVVTWPFVQGNPSRPTPIDLVFKVKCKKKSYDRQARVQASYPLLQQVLLVENIALSSFELVALVKLTFSMLGKNSSRHIVFYFSSYISQKTGFDISFKLSL